MKLKSIVITGTPLVVAAIVFIWLYILKCPIDLCIIISFFSGIIGLFIVICISRLYYGKESRSKKIFRLYDYPKYYHYLEILISRLDDRYTYDEVSLLEEKGFIRIYNGKNIIYTLSIDDGLIIKGHLNNLHATIYFEHELESIIDRINEYNKL